MLVPLGNPETSVWVGIGLAFGSWIDKGLADWQWIGRLVDKFMISIGLTDWQWIVGLVWV